MWKNGRLPEETRAFITADKVSAFVTSNLGKRMQKAAKLGNLYKEKQFVVGVPASRIMQSIEDDSIIVQGIIDAYFQLEDGSIVLLDYKTDRVETGHTY